MKAFYAFIGCIAAAILGMFLVNATILNGLFGNLPTIAISGAVFGFIACMPAFIRENARCLSTAAASAITVGAVVLFAGIFGVLNHTIEMSDMLIRVLGMSVVGAFGGWGFHAGRTLSR